MHRTRNASKKKTSEQAWVPAGTHILSPAIELAAIFRRPQRYVVAQYEQQIDNSLTDAPGIIPALNKIV